MARPHFLDLRATEQPWREVPMPAANLGIRLVRLESTGEGFTILGRFPAGFERTTAGGYEVTEEFLVLNGELELEGTVARRGVLCLVPAGVVRAPMRSPGGCTVLAWFAGPAIFHSAELLRGWVASGQSAIREAEPGSRAPRPVTATSAQVEGSGRPVAARFRAVHPGAEPAGTTVLDTADATWQVSAGAPELEPDRIVDIVDTDLTTWMRVGSESPPTPPGRLLVRRARAADVAHP